MIRDYSGLTSAFLARRPDFVRYISSRIVVGPRVTISGVSYSGKTTLARKVASGDHLKRFSTGDRFREELERQEKSLIDGLTALGQGSGAKMSDDVEIDMQTLEVMAGSNYQLFEGRMVGVLAGFLEEVARSSGRAVSTLKVNLHCAQAAQIERARAAGLKGERSTEPDPLERDAADRNRYLRIYRIDYMDGAWYDVDIDTTENNEDKVHEQVREEVMKYFRENGY